LAKGRAFILIPQLRIEEVGEREVRLAVEVILDVVQSGAKNRPPLVIKVDLWAIEVSKSSPGLKVRPGLAHEAGFHSPLRCKIPVDRLREGVGREQEGLPHAVFLDKSREGSAVGIILTLGVEGRIVGII
jgi:hypothetical protein